MDILDLCKKNTKWMWTLPYLLMKFNMLFKVGIVILSFVILTLSEVCRYWMIDIIAYNLINSWHIILVFTFLFQTDFRSVQKLDFSVANKTVQRFIDALIFTTLANLLNLILFVPKDLCSMKHSGWYSISA